MSETVEWIDPDGTTITLDVEQDATGRFSPKIAIEADAVPGQPGERRRDARHGVSEFSFPFWIHGVSEVDLRTQIRSTVLALDAVRGIGKVRVTAPGGDQREISCSVVDCAINEKGGETGPTDQRAAVVFRAHDPYWYDVSSISADFEITDTPSFFPWGGAVLFRLTSSEIFSDGTVVNNGDVETWPVWTIAGPGSVITLQNLTTGKSLTFLTTTITAAESIIIDTRPGYKTVTKSDGSNLFPDLSTLSDLWPLVRGSNLIRIQMSAADGVTSKVTLSYTKRYLTP